MHGIKANNSNQVQAEALIRTRIDHTRLVLPKAVKLLVIVQQAKDVVPLELFAALEEVQFDREGEAGDLAA